MRARIDLHLHSHWSDGELSPAELVGECKNLKLKIVSLTDHETGWGIKEAIEAGKTLGILVVPGIEFSCNFQGQEHHILGYFIDYENPELLEFLREMGRRRRERFLKMIEKIKNLGFFIEYTDVKKYAKGTLARPHLARAVIRNEKNFPKLQELNINTKYERDFFRRYLAEEKEAYEDWERPEVDKVISLIKKNGGIAVWAHPLWKCKNMRTTHRLAKKFKNFDLDGMEVFYPWHTRNRTKNLYKIAKEFDFIVSCGSDFHSFAFNLYSRIFAWQDFGLKPDFSWIRKEMRRRNAY